MELSEFYLEHFFHDFSMELVQPFVEMQLHGLLVDQDARGEIRKNYLTERDLAVDRIKSTTGLDIMGGKAPSSKKVMQLLYDVMKLPIQYHHKTKQPTADKKAIDKLSTKVDDKKRPLFLDILTARDLSVEINTFLDSQLDSDGRFRWSTNAAGAKSGRISTSGSPFWTGGNVQNWNKKIRNMVVAEDGYVFVYGDGEQAEARAVAFLAEDPDLMALFNSGVNVHKAMAQIIWGFDPKDIDSDHWAYKKSKAAVHAANYYMTKRMAAMLLKVNEYEANRVLETYHHRFPGVRSRFHYRVIEQVKRTRTLTTPFLRRRQFFERMGNDLLKGAISYIPQSTIADWLNCGLLRSRWYSRGVFRPKDQSIMDDFYTLKELRFAKSFAALQIPSFRPAVNIHDGLLGVVRIEHLRAAIDLMREALTFGIQFPSGELTIPVDIKIATRWGTERPANEEWIGRFESGFRDEFRLAA